MNMDCWSFAGLRVLLLRLSGWWGDGPFNLKRYCWRLLCGLAFWRFRYRGLHQWKVQRLHGSVFWWSGSTKLGPVAAEYEIARIDVVGAGGCTVGDLTINPWVAPLVEVLHKHKIPVGVASEEPVNACRNELWMLSCGG